MGVILLIAVFDVYAVSNELLRKRIILLFYFNAQINFILADL